MSAISRWVLGGLTWEAGLEGGIGQGHSGDQVKDGQGQAPDVSWNDHFTQQLKIYKKKPTEWHYVELDY